MADIVLLSLTNYFFSTFQSQEVQSIWNIEQKQRECSILRMILYLCSYIVFAVVSLIIGYYVTDVIFYRSNHMAYRQANVNYFLLWFLWYVLI